MNRESALKLILRLIGTSSLFALIFVAAPHRWMDSIHNAMGLGPFPNTPVVNYLARSTSALYAMLGGLFWVVSFDIAGHRRVLNYLGVAMVAFGVALFLIDWVEGLPRFWALWEGPFVTVLGLSIRFLSRSSDR